MAGVSHYHYAKITLKKKTNAASTLDVYVSQRPILNDSIYFVPILVSVDGIGNENADFLPREGTGQISLDNSPGSLGHEKTFLDLLEEYTYYDQEVLVYSATVEPGETDISGNATLLWRDKMQSISAEGGSLSIRMRSQLIPRHYVTYEITAERHADAPLSSIGKHLPVVYGEDVEVVAYPLSENETLLALFGYAANFGALYPNRGIKKVFMQEPSDGIWRQVKFGSGALVGSGSGIGTVANIGNGVKYAYWMDINTSTESYCLSMIRLQGYNGMAGAPVGTLTVEILEGFNNDSDAGPGRRIAFGTQDVSYYTWTGGSTWFNIEVPLDKIVPLISPNGYFIGISFSSETSTKIELRPTLDGVDSFIKPSGNQEWSLTTAGGIYWQGYGLNIIDDPDEDLHSRFAIAQVVQTYGQFTTRPDLSKLKFICEIDGMEFAGSLITSPVTAIATLLNTKTGDTYNLDDNFNSSFQSDTFNNISSGSFTRTLAGATTGKTTAEQLIRKIAEQTICRVCKIDDLTDDIGVYVWGSRIDATDTITDDDILEGVIFTSTGDRKIVNKVVLTYKKSLKQEDVRTILAQGGDRGYSSVLTLSHDDGAMGEYISAASESLFGERQLREDRYELISDSSTANTVAEYILRTNDLPHDFVTFRVPDGKFDLAPMSVFNLKTTTLPSRGGTALHARISQDIEYVTDPDRVWKGKTYRIQVYNLSKIIERGRPAVVEVTARLLIHPHDPT